MATCNPEELYIECRGQLKSYINKKVADRHLANDILHDTFLRVVNCSNSNKECIYPKAYLYRIANNLITDYHRKQNKPTPDWNFEDENMILNQKMEDCLLTYMQQLPASYKEALLLADLQNIPQQEIAKRLGIGISAVKSRIQRGREKLRLLIHTVCCVETDKYGNILNCTEKCSKTC